jgi:hypothetical protein
MKKLAVACLTLAALALIAGASWADLGMMGGEHFQMMRNSANNLAPGQYRASALDTVWYGFVTGGTASTVDYYYPPAGKNTFVNWDFDRLPNGAAATAGTVASLQGWTPELTPYTSGSARPPVSRPDWFLNFGNRPWTTANYNFDNADTAHPFPYWHQQDMTKVPVHPLFVANQNIEGAGVLWCGMISKVAKEIMPEYISQTAACSVNFPGYGDLWDQYVSHDINVASGGTTLTFKYAVDMDNRNDTGYNGGITTVPLQNGSAYDALSVWAGDPTVALPYGATIPNSADINDLLDATNRVNLSAALPTCIELDCNGWTGRSDSSGTSFTTATFGAGVGTPALGSHVRVVFRVRTNRSNSDQYNGVAYNGTTASNPYQPGGSKYGAAEIDEVSFSNATGYGDGQTTYLFNTALNMEGWAPSGKVLPMWVKTTNVGNNDPNVGGLGYDPAAGWDVNYADPCGIPGSSTSLCLLKNNVLSMFDTHSSDPNRPRNHYSYIWPNADGDMQMGAYSPPITIAGTPGFGRAGADINFDLYAYLPIDDAVFFWYWIRFKTPTLAGADGVLCPGWGRWARGTSLFYMESPNCSIQDFDPTALIPVTTMTDVQVDLQTINYCWGIQGAWGICSSNFSPLWDNVRFGMWQAPNAPAMALSDWEYWQDSYPVDNAIAYDQGATPAANSYMAMQKRSFYSGSVRTNSPTSSEFYIKNLSVGDPAIDAKTAVMVENATKNTREYTRPDGGVASADSCSIASSFGVTPGRVDCVFRVLPGPLTDKTGPWFQAYISDNGEFGTPGGHSGSWKWNVWNSVRLDTAEYDSWDSTLNNATQGPGASPTNYATLIHESDSHYSTLGYNHCLPLVLTNPPAGLGGQWISDCAVGRMTQEHTPIFPSYVFTPGTVVEYFYRSCYTATPTVAAMLPDTNFVYTNGSRYLLFRVLPNAWTDPTYGTPPWSGYGWLGGDGVGTSGGTKNEVVYKLGRPCVLFVNHSFGGGPNGLGPAYFPYHNTFDTLGITPFVDDYTSGAPSSGETGIGSYECRLATATFGFVGSSGPSVKQLAGYGQIYYNSGYLTGSSIADGQNNGDANADVQLFDAWLKLQGGRKGLWLNGSGIAQNLALLRPSGSPSQNFSSNTLGVLNAQVDGGSPSDNYRTLSGDASDCPTVVAGTSVWNPAQQTAIRGNLCAFNYDVIPARTDLTNSKSSQLYAIGSLGAGVVNTVSAAVSGESKTLIDALDFPYVRNVSCYDAYGRIYHMRTLYKTYFTDLSGGFCPDAVSPVGVDRPTGITALFQNSPNPFRPNRATTIRYSIAKKSNVALNILDVSGRVVRTLVNASKDAGDYTVSFDGRSANGSQLASGVYFYRLKVGDFESNKKMLMLK